MNQSLPQRSSAMDQATPTSPGLSALERLPASVFHRMTLYIPVVTYENKQEVARWKHKYPPFFIQVRLERGYALAVCSRTCHGLMEETAQLYLSEFYAAEYFVHPFQHSPAETALSRFYRVKDCECRYRSAYRNLEDTLRRVNFQTEDDERNDTRQDRLLLITHAQTLLQGPLVLRHIPYVVELCMEACQRALRYRKRVRNSRQPPGIHSPWSPSQWPDPEAVVPVEGPVQTMAKTCLDAILHLLSLPRATEVYRGTAMQTSAILEALYVRHVLYIQDELLEETESCLERALALELASDIKKENWIQRIRLTMYWRLINRKIHTNRTEAGFTLLERARNDLRGLDPFNLYAITRIAAKAWHRFGLDRSFHFVLEAKRELDAMNPESSMLTRVINYRRELSSWIDDLERRRRRSPP